MVKRALLAVAALVNGAWPGRVGLVRARELQEREKNPCHSLEIRLEHNMNNRMRPGSLQATRCRRP